MKIANLLQTSSEWLHGDSGGAGNKVVLCTRVRLARNLNQHPFPGWAKKAERERILSIIQPAVLSLPEMGQAIVCDSMDHFSPLEKQVLVEQHLISREHAAKSAGSGLAVNKPRSLSVMINEEDHLRLQVFRAGLQLKNLWKMADKIDSELDEKLDFAFSPQIGYLTACPTNVGTGMRASVMMHLPALVLKEQIGQIIKAVNRIGLAVRGLYGEGTEALGNLFQVSNQMTLGESETAIIERLQKVISQIIDHEENARVTLLQEKARVVADQVGRAYGIMRHSYAMSSKEALNLLSLLRFGADLGMFPAACRVAIDECFIKTQPAHLQLDYDRKLTTEERDGIRSDFLREHLKDVPAPDCSKLGNVPPPSQDPSQS
ncbi:MAG TPA: protein arginine kinase [Candidatus Methylacidiphilales bacterium]